MDEARVGFAEDVEDGGEGAEYNLQCESSVVIGMMCQMKIELVVILLGVVSYSASSELIYE